MREPNFVAKRLVSGFEDKELLRIFFKILQLPFLVEHD